MTARFVAALVASVSILAAAPAGAADDTFEAEYFVSLYGLTIGEAKFTGKIGSEGFAIAGTMSSAGVARIIADTEARVSANGRVKGNGLEPSGYTLQYRYGDERETTEISYPGGIARARQTPAPEPRREDWIDIGEDELRGVLDPISATIVMTGSASEVCNRTVKVYDGELRANLVLSAITGEEGGYVTCNARFQPVAGYHQSNSTLTYIRDKSDIVLTFGPIGESAYGLQAASVETRIGTVRIAASRIDIR